jgi:1-acyl-sn-glycerol-3-phosphate acyltransferase
VTDMLGSYHEEVAKWDPVLTKRVINIIRPVTRRYFRSEVRGLDRLPPGAALAVSNHSGGLFAMDVPVFAVAFYDRFGYERPVYTLGHDVLFSGPQSKALMGTGFIRATRRNAYEALCAGGVVMVFPGGDYDVYRPSTRENVIDFNGRTGYVKTAIEAGVPIVPVVSIGAQESQLFLSRGGGLAQLLRLKRLLRIDILPISFGVPFGFSAVLPINLPLPTKIVTEVLEPVDVFAQFGRDPDIAEVDGFVRSAMQTALDRLAQRRRLPVIG